jgi:hypothetical protein
MREIKRYLIETWKIPVSVPVLVQSVTREIGERVFVWSQGDSIDDKPRSGIPELDASESIASGGLSVGRMEVNLLLVPQLLPARDA